MLCAIGIAQSSVKPRIISSVSPEKRRDRALERVLVARIGEDANIRYHFNKVDLNSDGISEVLVFVFGEHQCGSGGCHAYLFKKAGKSYRLVTAFGPARNPIIVSSTKTNGWNDLIFLNWGGGIFPAYYSIGRFNGRTYPDNPTVDESCPPIKKRYRGTAYVIGEYHDKAGLKLPRR